MRLKRKLEKLLLLKYKKYVFLLALALLTAGLIYYARDIIFQKSPREISPANPEEIKTLDILTLAKNKETIKPIVEKFGIRAVIGAIIDKSGGGSVFDCHQEAHNVGRVGYDAVKQQAFALCDASCHSGCYHGAMESFLQEKGTQDLAKNIDGVCKTFETSFGNFECLHGVGHGVMAYLDYDLPETIKNCGKLTGSFAQNSCYGGAFMENVLTGQGLGAREDQHETKWVNRTDPHFPCDKVDQSYEVQTQCYQMQTSWMLYINGYNFEGVVKDCERAPSNMVPICFRSFGRDAAGHTLRNPSKILDLCDKVLASRSGPKSHYKECIYGALNVIVDFWGPALKDQAAEFCKLTPSIGKNHCWATLAWRIKDVFSDPAIQKIRCDEFEESYKHLCQK